MDDNLKQLADLHDENLELKKEIERLKAERLPDGFKVYECTDCKTINVLKDNGLITVGSCSNCEHPLWN